MTKDDESEDDNGVERRIKLSDVSENEEQMDRA
jgi:hypothetical protein